MGMFLSSLALSVFMSSSITLETDKDLHIFSNTRKMIASNGAILVMTPFELYHWDSTGRLVGRYGLGGKVSEPNFLSTFHYDSRQEIIWLIYTNPPHSYFFDKKGKVIGEGFLEDDSGKEKPAYYRDLLSVGSRVFAQENTGTGSWGGSQKQIIQLVDYEITGSGVRITHQGKPFGKFSELQAEYQYDFKKHWLVQNGLTKNFSLVNQLDNHLQWFHSLEDASIEQGLVTSGPPRKIYLPDWTPPPTLKLNQVKPGPNDYHLFSQITGAFPWDDQSLIVGYTLPNPADPKDLAFGIQRYKFDGTVEGKPLKEKGLFLGVHNRQVYALQTMGEKGSKIYRVKIFGW